MRRAIQDGRECELGETPGGAGDKESSAASPGQPPRLLASNGYRFGPKLGAPAEGWTTAEVLASDRKLLDLLRLGGLTETWSRKSTRRRGSAKNKTAVPTGVPS